MTVAGVGNAAKFQPADDEIRFSFRFEVLERDAAGNVIQRGVCTLPDGRKLSLTVNDEKGASTPEGDVRVFAGLRSDPFYLAWDRRQAQEASQSAAARQRALHGRRARYAPRARSREGLAVRRDRRDGPHPAAARPHSDIRPARIDWVGRPEQTNMRLNNPAMAGVDDLRDLWNQQTPFAIPKALQPLFLQRLKDSFAVWDRLDGKADWTPEALAANANVFLDDFLLFDVAKPITDESHLEIEKSTLDGRPYQTGGGRTVDANSIDILLTWLVNRDREFLQGGATGATKPGMKVFPYFATPNTELQTVAGLGRARGAARRRVVGDRPVQSRLASGWSRRVRLIGEGIGSAPQDRNARRQGNRRTPGGGRRREAILSLHAGRRDSRLALHRHDRSQAEGKRLSRRMARGIPGQQSTRHRRPDHGVDVG